MFQISYLIFFLASFGDVPVLLSLCSILHPPHCCTALSCLAMTHTFVQNLTIDFFSCIKYLASGHSC